MKLHPRQAPAPVAAPTAQTTTRELVATTSRVSRLPGRVTSSPQPLLISRSAAPAGSATVSAIIATTASSFPPTQPTLRLLGPEASMFKPAIGPIPTLLFPESETQTSSSFDFVVVLFLVLGLTTLVAALMLIIVKAHSQLRRWKISSSFGSRSKSTKSVESIKVEKTVPPIKLPEIELLESDEKYANSSSFNTTTRTHTSGTSSTLISRSSSVLNRVPPPITFVQPPVPPPAAFLAQTAPIVGFQQTIVSMPVSHMVPRASMMVDHAQLQQQQQFAGVLQYPPLPQVQNQQSNISQQQSQQGFQPVSEGTSIPTSTSVATTTTNLSVSTDPSHPAPAGVSQPNDSSVSEGSGPVPDSSHGATSDSQAPSPPPAESRQRSSLLLEREKTHAQIFGPMHSPAPSSSLSSPTVSSAFTSPAPSPAVAFSPATTGTSTPSPLPRHLMMPFSADSGSSSPATNSAIANGGGSGSGSGRPAGGTAPDENTADSRRTIHGAVFVDDDPYNTSDDESSVFTVGGNSKRGGPGNRDSSVSATGTVASSGLATPTTVSARHSRSSLNSVSSSSDSDDAFRLQLLSFGVTNWNAMLNDRFEVEAMEGALESAGGQGDNRGGGHEEKADRFSEGLIKQISLVPPPMDTIIEENENESRRGSSALE